MHWLTFLVSKINNFEIEVEMTQYFECLLRLPEVDKEYKYIFLYFFRFFKMGIFDAFRSKPGPTLYDSNKTAVTADVLEIGFIYASIILFVSLVAVTPGLKGKDCTFTLIRIFLGVFVTAGKYYLNYLCREIVQINYLCD